MNQDQQHATSILVKEKFRERLLNEVFVLLTKNLLEVHGHAAELIFDVHKTSNGRWEVFAPNAPKFVIQCPDETTANWVATALSLAGTQITIKSITHYLQQENPPTIAELKFKHEQKQEGMN